MTQSSGLTSTLCQRGRLDAYFPDEVGAVQNLNWGQLPANWHEDILCNNLAEWALKRLERQERALKRQDQGLEWVSAFHSTVEMSAQLE